MPPEQKAAININQVIIINGTRYKVKVAPFFQDILHPTLTSVEQQLILIPLPPDAANTVDRFG